MKRIGSGKSSGKVILMGEYACVFGYPSIAVPTPRHKIETTITMKQPEKVLDSVQDLFLKKIRKRLDIFDPLSLKIDSNIPLARGMGSSAALFHSIVLALNDLYSLNLSKKNILELVSIGETIAHGNPSGLDATTVVSGKLTYYQKYGVQKNIDININASLLVVDSGIPSNTKSAVDFLNKIMRTATDDTTRYLKQLGNNTEKFFQLLTKGALKELGESMISSHEVLKKIGASLPVLDEIVQIALDNGGLGAKLTGSGRGGCVIVLCKSRTVNHIKTTIKSLSPEIRIWEQKI
ncbi:mevalonate kinase [Oceanobacillus sojae]|uniref:mevalonate kinase n=1 Tax=Oceanobacillus sojae TaxID=582851 RepID=UPI00362B3257